jgi:maltose alpha-D-glucosyltransferase/alpha-amylase
VAVESFLQDSAAEPEIPPSPPPSDTFLLDLSRQSPPEVAHRLFGAYLETARVLGERIGQMHQTLAAADASDPEFAPEAMAPFHVRALYQSIRTGLRDTMALLRSGQKVLSDSDRAASELLLAASTGVDARARRLLDEKIGGQRIRIHGDLHLGQVLDTGGDVMFIDFEGEPARPLGERRLKRSALTDLAGMLRSFHYAAHRPRLERSSSEVDGVADPDLERWSTFWYHWVAAACVRGYREATHGASFLPDDDRSWSILLDALLLSKAAYELRYELGSRPAWAGVPIDGLLDLIGAAPEGG